jgi:fatty-acyl-CoA synthase
MVLSTHPVKNLVTALLDARKNVGRAATFLSSNLSARDWSWRELTEAAWERGRSLLSVGARRGDRVAVALRDEQEFVLTFLGAVMVGIVPVPVSPPHELGHSRLQRERIVSVLRCSNACAVVCEPTTASLVEAERTQIPALRHVLQVEDLKRALPGDASWLDVTTAEANDVCFIQYTSGSTGSPKGVVVSHGNLVANYDALHSALGLDAAREVGVSWVPLFHDLGLIGSVVFSVLAGAHQVYIPTLTFAARPQIWLQQVHRYRGSMLSTNNFGLRAAVKRAPRERGALDLSCVRVIHVGSEPVSWEATEAFVSTYAPFGLAPEAINPAYGLAEATLAVSASSPSERPRIVEIDADRYASGQAMRLLGSNPAGQGAGARVRRVVSCGRPLPGFELEIAREGDGPTGEGVVGEIVLRGPCIAQGYFEDPDASAEAFREGGLRTGDLGFCLDGELFVSGRSKDVVIVGGCNYHPQDIERVATVEGVRLGQCVAFGLETGQGEALVIVAECANPSLTAGLARSIRGAVARDVGIDVRDVVIVAPWSLPKTSSGKLQRLATKSLFLCGELKRVDGADAVAMET